jgi:hypothetical protein
MLLGDIPHDRWQVDGKLERVRSDQETDQLMWLIAPVRAGFPGVAATARREAADDQDPAPHPSDVLEFVADTILQALDGHPPRLFRKPVGNVTGAKELSCIAFAESYQDFAGDGSWPAKRPRMARGYYLTTTP